MQTTALPQTNSFLAIAEAWVEKEAPLRSASWLADTRRWLDRDICPVIGGLDLDTVKGSQIRSIMRTLEARGYVHSADSIRLLVSRIYRFAIASDLTTGDPAAALLGKASKPKSRTRLPLDASDIPAFLTKIDAYPGRQATKLALKLLLLTFVCKTELVEATRDEFRLQEGIWRIPAERMKRREAHTVPLSTQAADYVRQLIRLNGHSPFLLPHYSDADKPMAGSMFNRALDKIGYGGRFSPQGFRATASTLLIQHGYRPDLVQCQLAHVDSNRARKRLGRAVDLAERRAMMQYWRQAASGTGIAVVFRRLPPGRRWWGGTDRWILA